ncbi:IpaD/SipD/SspD family type III secretion system needle tip protein [Stenotrophomonas sp. PD6]|uniref:IpaD/SipD/SspD family type III secretion system needle tip protein n=1 Tax=Stenotrophomonas sp. PD6 TaxID=3368612 RepID=UPI003BA2DD36
MTDSITNYVAASAARPASIKQAEAQQIAPEAPLLSKEVRARLLQAGQLAQAARSAALAQIARCNPLAAEGLGTVDPPSTEVLQNPELLEDFRRKQQREANLVAGLQQAGSRSERAQGDLLRSLVFLMPQLRPAEEEDGISLPGFESPMKDPSSLDTSGLIWDSHIDFYGQISAMLGLLKSEWLSKYQDALGKFLEFYQKFSDIMEQLKPVADGDKGDIKIDFSTVRGLLVELMANFGLDANALASFPNEKAAESFKNSLGLPGLKVTGPDAEGTWHVKMDVSAVDDLIKSMPTGGEVKWDSARYNAWVSSKDSNMEQIKHVSKVLGEKLSEMTQKYDNIVKILSSTIDKINEADMGFVRGL